jgi:hypothetical protein
MENLKNNSEIKELSDWFNDQLEEAENNSEDNWTDDTEYYENNE